MPTIPFSVFPKFLQSLSLEALADCVLAAGLDSVNLVVRDGFWVTPETLHQALPNALQQLRGRGLQVHHATVAYELADLAADATPLAILAEHGIRSARIGYVPRSADPAAAVDHARRQLASIAEPCLAHGITAIYQVHHGRAVASASMAWQLVRELDPRAVGIMLDPGNQQHEGWEDPFHQFRLLGPHVAAIGVKDVLIERDPAAANEPGKGWRKRWTSCAEGVIDWQRIFTAARESGFAGTLVLMPMYLTAPEQMDQHLTVMQHEVAYLRKIMATVWQEISQPSVAS